MSSASNRPYPPPSNVSSVLFRLRSRNVPDRIDAEYLRDVNIPDGTISRTLFGLRFLKLIDEGGLLTEAAKSIVVSTDEEYKATLSGLVKEAYAEVFKVVNPAEDPQDRILNVFRRYTPGSQRPRMVTFFLGMCSEAGIPTLDTPRGRSMNQPSRPKQQRAAKPSGIANRSKSSPVQPIPVVHQIPTDGLLLAVTDEDIGLLEEAEFNEVWSALGKIARARARGRTRLQAIQDRKGEEVEE